MSLLVTHNCSLDAHPLLPRHTPVPIPLPNRHKLRKHRLDPLQPPRVLLRERKLLRVVQAVDDVGTATNGRVGRSEEVTNSGTLDVHAAALSGGGGSGGLASGSDGLFREGDKGCGGREELAVLLLRGFVFRTEVGLVLKPLEDCRQRMRQWKGKREEERTKR
jgi:hypothetical protein